MKQLYLLLFAALTTLVSCKKQEVLISIPEPSATITVTTHYNTGKVTNETLNILPAFNALYFSKSNSDGFDRLFINIGAIRNDPKQVPFGLSLVFQTISNPEQLNFRYKFPADNPYVRTAFKYEFNPNSTAISIDAQNGVALFQYDNSTKTIHGSFSDLRFDHFTENTFEYRTHTIVNGTFKYISKKQ
jgi:hypothetical protein